MDDLNKEIAETFGDVAAEGTPVRFRLTNQLFKGNAQSLDASEALREPGYEPQGGVLIAAPRAQFKRRPDEYPRERLEVLDAPFAGVYVVTNVTPDAAHFTIRAMPSED